MTLRIRRTTMQDAAALAHLMSDPTVFPQQTLMPYSSEEQWKARLAEALHPSKNDLLLSADLNGRMVGAASLLSVGPSPRRRHVMMSGASVLPEAQGKGIGKALAAALFDYADRWANVLRIEATVFASNQKAINLNLGFGFQIEGRMKGYALRDGVYEDVLMVARMHPNPPRFEFPAESS
jgi:putative acetyltransferase